MLAQSGLGFCFFCLQNIKGLSWSHKNGYRVYCELDLDKLLITKTFDQEKSEVLAVIPAVNKTRLKDFMHGRVACRPVAGCITLSMTTTVKGLELKLAFRCLQRE